MAKDRPRVLFADDHSEMREMMRAALQNRYEFEAVCDGAEALSVIEKSPPDLILSDIAMPLVGGLELLRALREDPRFQFIPVILLTGNESEDAVIDGLRAGADELLTKPCSMRGLLARVEGHLERARVRGESEKHAREINEMLMRSNQELEQFAFVVTHDLQEPIRKIMAYGDRLAHVRAEEQRDLDKLIAAAVRMKAVIEDVLSLARLSDRPAVLENVDLRVLLDEVSADLEFKIAESRAEIILGEACVFRANRAHFSHLLQNLISNSIKFRRKDVPPRVVVECRRAEPAEVEILVSDNGIGFDNRHAAKIFRPFERLHSRAEYEGTGIGLAIVHRIVRNHGGRIRAESTPGQGTTFVITLPQDA